MKYNILINQAKALEWELNLSEAAVFAFVYELPSWAESMHIDGQPWYFASRNKAIEEVPIITSKPDTMYRLYKSLQDKGLIRWQKVGGREYIQITEKGKTWNKAHPSLGKKSEVARKIFRDSAEKNPTYNTIIDNITIDKLETDFTDEKKSISSVQETINNLTAYKTATESFITLAAAARLKYPEESAEPYFLNEQQKGRYYMLTVPTAPDDIHSWLSKHVAGINAWALRERQFSKGKVTSETTTKFSNIKLPKV